MIKIAALALLVPLAVSAAEPDKRNFYDVLEDLMGDFEYDLKNGAVTGLRDVAIRNVAMSENIPPSFKSHLDLVVTERILKNTKARVIQCLPCRAKKTTLNGDQVVISSPDSNPAELARIAKMSGIQNYMDVAFAYQPTGMILSMYITDPETGSVTWSRSYNSETSRASAHRRGVDFSQLDDARRSVEYKPTLHFRPTIYYLLERNVEEYTNTIGFGLRVVERYDNRKKEVGFEANYLIDATALAGVEDTSNKNLYAGFNITLLFVHAWNFIGEEENYNKIRGSFFGAIGGTYASGYLGALFRTGYEWRLGKLWAITPTVGYRPASTKFIDGIEGGEVSGFEAGIGVSALF